MLDEHLAEIAVDKKLSRLRAGQEQQLDRRSQIERELSLIEARQARLIEAIKRGDAVQPLVAALEAEEERRKLSARELEALGAVSQVTALDSEQIKRDLRARVADVAGLLGRRKPQARQMLRKLLTKIELTPVEENGRRGYRFIADGSFERLLTGAVLEPLARSVVAPTGSDRAWSFVIKDFVPLSAWRSGRNSKPVFNVSQRHFARSPRRPCRRFRPIDPTKIHRSGNPNFCAQVGGGAGSLTGSESAAARHYLLANRVGATCVSRIRLSASNLGKTGSVSP